MVDWHFVDGGTSNLDGTLTISIEVEPRCTIEFRDGVPYFASGSLAGMRIQSIDKEFVPHTWRQTGPRERTEYGVDRLTVHYLSDDGNGYSASWRKPAERKMYSFPAEACNT